MIKQLSGDIAQLFDDIPTHQALGYQAVASVGHSAGLLWKCQPEGKKSLVMLLIKNGGTWFVLVMVLE